MTLKDGAGYFALAIKLGILDCAAAVAWADGKILEIEAPPLWLIDLALSRDQGETLDMLRDAPGVPTPDLVEKLVITLVRRRWLAGILSVDDIDSLATEIIRSTEPEYDRIHKYGVWMCAVMIIEGINLENSLHDELCAFESFDAFLPE